ncbi:hypothetical protein SAMN05216167_12712 [Spirosoma endophyticum]|uniref:Transposase IS4-like domain-containing protein n=1 Tax=Spirosoma endophyticum TaxID=662367 RepID=A0A1I2FNL5_9BACT|nr:hypothetical protein SAMN05216167_12712 [Spirosoma endophyticum]
MTGDKLPCLSVYYYFRQFKRRGIWEQILDSLVVKERKRRQSESTPSLLAINSQSVKIMQFIAEETGIDANKKINGRKRSIAVDRLGFPWALTVTAANESDNEAGQLVVERLKGKVSRLEVIAANHGCKVSFINRLSSSIAGRLRLHKNLKAVIASYVRRTDGPSNAALAGSILGDACFEMWRKLSKVRMLC